jgi:NAD(P)-dependent dehydrogenase (short-subunit alcohol dehydrogenase family)
MLKGKIVAIAGAAGGLGPTVARAFFEAGAVLSVAGRSRESLVRVLDNLEVPSAQRMEMAVDLLDPAGAEAWASETIKRFGRVDVVLHLVGGYKGGASIEDIDVAEWAALSDLLVRTTLNVARAFVVPLKTGGWGRFIAVSSPRAQAPTAKTALYAMAKAASDALVLAVADELRGTGATANLIVVDSIDTPEARESGQKKAYGKTTPAEEIAAAMLFLCSDQAATINATRLPLTGRG